MFPSANVNFSHVSNVIQRTTVPNAELPVKQLSPVPEQTRPEDCSFPIFKDINAFLSLAESRNIPKSVLTDFLQGDTKFDQKYLNAIAFYAWKNEPDVWSWIKGAKSGITALSSNGNEGHTVEYANALVSELGVGTTLTKLEFKFYDDDVLDVAALAKAITATSLTTLNFYGCHIDDAGATAIAEALNTNTSLTKLRFQSCAISDVGVAALAKALETKNTTLNKLELILNQIGEEGAKALAKILNNNHHLTNISLYSCSIGDAGAIEIANALETNTALIKLDLSSNSFGEKGAAALAKALKINRTLATLDISSCKKISSAVVAAFADALKKNAILTTFDFDYKATGHADAASMKAIQDELAKNQYRCSAERAITLQELSESCFKSNSTMPDKSVRPGLSNDTAREILKHLDRADLANLNDVLTLFRINRRAW